jgi:glucan phosphorylase
VAKTDQSDRIRIGRSAKAIARDFLDNLQFLQGCTLEDAGRNDLYMALSYTVRDRMLASRARDIPAAAGSSLAEGSKTVSILTPSAFHDSNPLLKEIMALIRSGRFSPDTRDLFKPLVDRLMDRDEYMLFADFDAYIDCQAEIGRATGMRTVGPACRS